MIPISRFAARLGKVNTPRPRSQLFHPGRLAVMSEEFAENAEWREILREPLRLTPF